MPHTCECGVNTTLSSCWRCWRTENDIQPTKSKPNQLTQTIRATDRSK